jgi:hypothetical protein
VLVVFNAVDEWMDVKAPSDYVTGQLKGLSAADAQKLLGSYFEKVWNKLLKT